MDEPIRDTSILYTLVWYLMFKVKYYVKVSKKAK